MGISSVACAKRFTVAAALSLPPWRLIKLSSSRSSPSSMLSTLRSLKRSDLTSNPYLATVIRTTKFSALASVVTAPSAFAASSIQSLRDWWGSASPCICTMTTSLASLVQPRSCNCPECMCPVTRRSVEPAASTTAMWLTASVVSPEPSCTASGSRSYCPMTSGEAYGSSSK
jgi:hypothetical protein